MLPRQRFGDLRRAWEPALSGGRICAPRGDVTSLRLYAEGVDECVGSRAHTASNCSAFPLPPYANQGMLGNLVGLYDEPLVIDEGLQELLG